MIVKVCGLTRAEDVRAACDAGVDWLGLNFWPASKRAIEVETGVALAEAARAARADVVLVGVFVNAPVDEVRAIARTVGLDYCQLHGDESPAECRALGRLAIKALGLGGPTDLERVAASPCDVVLCDTPSAGYGGTGRTFDWRLARAAVATGKRILLAGGLHEGNVADAIAAVAPWGVDTASGVESAPGIKDPARMRAFVRAARGARGDHRQETP